MNAANDSGGPPKGASHAATIPIEAQVSADQLIHAAAQLPPEEFASFIARLLDLQARNRGSATREKPTEVMIISKSRTR